MRKDDLAGLKAVEESVEGVAARQGPLVDRRNEPAVHARVEAQRPLEQVRSRFRQADAQDPWLGPVPDPRYKLARRETETL